MGSQYRFNHHNIPILVTLRCTEIDATIYASNKVYERNEASCYMYTDITMIYEIFKGKHCIICSLDVKYSAFQSVTITSKKNIESIYFRCRKKCVEI